MPMIIFQLGINAGTSFRLRSGLFAFALTFNDYAATEKTVKAFLSFVFVRR